MITYAYTFESWPRTQGDDPIFTCSEEAIYYAHLCSDEKDEINRLTMLRRAAYQGIAKLRAARQPNYQRMMDLAVKAQFYRECIEEIGRIDQTKYCLKQGGK